MEKNITYLLKLLIIIAIVLSGISNILPWSSFSTEEIGTIPNIQAATLYNWGINAPKGGLGTSQTGWDYWYSQWIC